MKLQDIHVYFCIIQIIFILPTIISIEEFIAQEHARSEAAKEGVIIDFGPPRFLFFVYLYMLITIFLGGITLPYYFFKKISFDYKLLSVLNLLLLGLIWFSPVIENYWPIIILNLSTFILALYIWKLKK